MKIRLKSLATGIVGEYPASHMLLDPDLVPAGENEGICPTCVIQTDKKEA